MGKRRCLHSRSHAGRAFIKKLTLKPLGLHRGDGSPTDGPLVLTYPSIFRGSAYGFIQLLGNILPGVLNHYPCRHGSAQNIEKGLSYYFRRSPGAGKSLPANETSGGLWYYSAARQYLSIPSSSRPLKRNSLRAGRETRRRRCAASTRRCGRVSRKVNPLVNGDRTVDNLRSQYHPLFMVKRKRNWYWFRFAGNEG